MLGLVDRRGGDLPERGQRVARAEDLLFDMARDVGRGVRIRVPPFELPLFRLGDVFVDGLFEVIERCGAVVRTSAHLDRLYPGADGLAVAREWRDDGRLLRGENDHDEILRPELIDEFVERLEHLVAPERLD